MEINDIIKLQKMFDKDHQSNVDWSTKIDDNNLEDLSFLFVSLFGEIGEASNILKKIIRGDFSLKEKKPDLVEEIVDIMIYLIKIIYQLDIDIEKEFLSKLDKNKYRFKRFERDGKSE